MTKQQGTKGVRNESAPLAPLGPPVKMHISVILSYAGLAAIGSFVLLLLLPGHNIHAGAFTELTFLFGLTVPAICFLAGFILSFFPLPTRSGLGRSLSCIVLLLYIIWLL